MSELSAASLEPLVEQTQAIGLLVLPSGASASVRDYHLRRMQKLAASYPRWACDTAAAPDPVWLGKLPRCTPTPPNATVHFAFAGSAPAQGSAAAGTSGLLLAALGGKLGLRPTALPQPAREARFALMVRTRGAWRVHALPGTATAASIGAFCEQHLPWRSTLREEAPPAAARGAPSERAEAAGKTCDEDEGDGMQVCDAE